MTFDIVSLLIGLAAGAGSVYVLLQARLAALNERVRQQDEAKAAMGDAFSVLAQDALRKSSEDFLRLAQEKLKSAQADGAHDLEKRQKAISDLLDPIRKNLEGLGSAVEQIKGTDKVLRDDLMNLSRETAKLTGALRDPAGQGRWGEFILEGLLQKAGLLKGVHYETQVSMETDKGRQRPDAVINLHDGLHIIVDAKAPINEAALRFDQQLSADEADDAATKLAGQVRDHIKTLSRKGYWENVESPDFTVLFLPSEYLFSQALRSDPQIVDFAATNNIIICSPTLLMSLLRVVHMGWRQAALAKNAQDISERGAELYQRLGTFAAHFEKIGRGISGAMASYNDAVGSLERMILPSARKLKELHVQTGGKEVQEPVLLEMVQKNLSSPELVETSEDKKTRKNA